jgi:hypothetical protein
VRSCGVAGFRAIDSRRDADRKLAFDGDPFMFLGNIFDAIARLAGISVGSRNETKNFVGTRGRRSKHPRLELDDLTDIEPVSHEIILLSFVGAATSAYWMLAIVYGDDRVELR